MSTVSKQEEQGQPSEEQITLKQLEQESELSKGPVPTEQGQTELQASPLPQEQTSAVVQAPTPQVEEPSIFKEVRDIVIKVSQDHMNEIVKELKNDILRLEYVDSKGKMQVDRREYKPMTIGMNKKVVKVGKRLRLLEADILGMGEQGGMDPGTIQKKYSDVLDSDVDSYDLSPDEGFPEIKANYIVAEKAKIYWGINDIDNYSLHDLMIVESLYESRNNFAPSLQTTPQRNR